MDHEHSETERVRRLWDRFAGKYDRTIGVAENFFFRGGRAWACGQASGKVLEVAAGTGLNLQHYPPGTDLTAIDISENMLGFTREKAGRLGLTAAIRQGDAQNLAFPDQSFDTVVLTLSLCNIPDDRRAASEIHRVLRPGGRLILLEHVRSPCLPVRLVQRLINPLSVRLQGDHQTRDPMDYLESVGFEVEHLERRRLGIAERVIARRR